MPTLRKRLLVDQWVIISSQRASRPRQLRLGRRPADGRCPFCPGDTAITPPPIDHWQSPAFPDDPWGVQVVPNKYPSLLDGAGSGDEMPDTAVDGLYQSQPGFGAHEVFIEAPQHHCDWASLPPRHIAVIFEAWRQRIDAVSSTDQPACAICFKNHGATAGATLEHVHSQLMAPPLVVPQLRDELRGARLFYEEHHCCALCEMLQHERGSGERIIAENASATAVAPFGSRMPYEAWILPRDHQDDFRRATASQLRDLATLTLQVLAAYDQLFEPLCYNLILHTVPFDLAGEPYYHWHLEMLPRSGQIAGLELGSDLFVHATASEVAAQQLRQRIGSPG